MADTERILKERNDMAWWIEQICLAAEAFLSQADELRDRGVPEEHWVRISFIRRAGDNHWQNLPQLLRAEDFYRLKKLVENHP